MVRSEQVSGLKQGSRPYVPYPYLMLNFQQMNFFFLFYRDVPTLNSVLLHRYLIYFFFISHSAITIDICNSMIEMIFHSNNIFIFFSFSFGFLKKNLYYRSGVDIFFRVTDFSNLTTRLKISKVHERFIFNQVLITKDLIKFYFFF